MTHTMYLNQYGIPNRSFIDIATRVVPDNMVGSWTREPVAAATPPAPSFPTDDAWRQAQTKDLVATAAFSLTLFASAIAAVIL
jgi:hypothetical protein